MIEIGCMKGRKGEVWMAHLVVTYPLVVVLGILVQPHLAQPYAVPLEHVHAASPLVRRPFPEDVSHVRAGHDFQGAWKKHNRRSTTADGKGVGGGDCVYFVAKKGCNAEGLSFFSKDFLRVELVEKLGREEEKGFHERSWRLGFDRDGVDWVD